MKTIAEQVDERWGLHEHRDPAAGRRGHCLVFVIDPRFVRLPEHDPNLHFRLGASFGHNPFTPEMACGFIPPPVRPGEYVFGIHLIATKANAVTVFDEWFDAREASNGFDASNATEYARTILSSIPDEEYMDMVKEDQRDVVSIQRSEIDVDCIELVGPEEL